jgi:hypothetical protein
MLVSLHRGPQIKSTLSCTLFSSFTTNHESCEFLFELKKCLHLCKYSPILSFTESSSADTPSALTSIPSSLPRVLSRPSLNPQQNWTEHTTHSFRAVLPPCNTKAIRTNNRSNKKYSGFEVHTARNGFHCCPKELGSEENHYFYHTRFRTFNRSRIPK